MPDPTPADLSLEHLNDLKIATAKEISSILNRFTAQTMLDIHAVEVDKLCVIGRKCLYIARLDVRL